jgi:signal recognition particle subunit SEC65
MTIKEAKNVLDKAGYRVLREDKENPEQELNRAIQISFEKFIKPVLKSEFGITLTTEDERNFQGSIQGAIYDEIKVLYLDFVL